MKVNFTKFSVGKNVLKYCLKTIKPTAYVISMTANDINQY